MRIHTSERYRWWVYSAIALGLFVSVADHGSVAVALPSIANEFRTDLPTVQWVMIAYALTISSLLLPMGRLSDIVGRKRLYVGGFTIFLVAAFLCIVANDIVSLIGARVLMGLGASMTQATSMAILLSAFPESERGKALGLQISALGAGAVGGPAIGGFVVDAFGWQGVFFLTVALSVIAIAAAQVVLDRKRTDGATSGGRFDLVGAVTSTAVMIVFLLAMSNGAEMGWRSPPIVVGFAAVLGLLSFFTIWELRSRSPMLDLTLFRHRVFAIGIASNAMSYMGISSVRFLMPFYLQAVLGYSPAQVGLVLVPSAFAWMITGPFGGRLSDRFGWTPFNVGGLLLSAVGLFILSRATEMSPLWLIVVGTVTQSVGTGTFNAPNNSSIFSVVERRRYGVISGFINLVRNTANITGIAVATTIVVTVMGSQGFEPSLAAVSDSGAEGVLGAFTTGMKTAYLTMSGLVLLGAALSVLKGGRDRTGDLPEGTGNRVEETEAKS
ncbi:MAG: MFS transporter [Dehalococcoidia bacterium]|nr:MFS transporter [Dehalococcoidia bacterium]